jgi:hypothetical protein
MPFGRHRGQLIADIPSRYLRWLLRECDLEPILYAAVMRELSGRGEETAPKREDRSVADVRGVVKSWYREMALRFHPDRTLDNGTAMRAINHGYERLREMLGVTR